MGASLPRRKLPVFFFQMKMRLSRICSNVINTRVSRLTQYEGLKCIRSRLEALLVEKDADIAANHHSVATASPYLHKYFELRNEFAYKLHSETEKITLFSLARLGELANAVGVLRVMTGGSQSSGLNACQTREDEEAPMDYSKHNYDEVGEKCECSAVGMLL